MNWKILAIVDEGVNSEVGALLEFWGCHAKHVDDAWYFLEWIA